MVALNELDNNILIAIETLLEENNYPTPQNICQKLQSLHLAEDSVLSFLRAAFFSNGVLQGKIIRSLHNLERMEDENGFVKRYVTPESYKPSHNAGRIEYYSLDTDGKRQLSHMKAGWTKQSEPAPISPYAFHYPFMG